MGSGCSHTVGLNSDGTVVATGADYYGQCSGVESWTDIFEHFVPQNTLMITQDREDKWNLM